MPLTLAHLKLLREQTHTHTKHNIIPSFATSTQNKVVAEFMFFVMLSANHTTANNTRDSQREREREPERKKKERRREGESKSKRTNK